jgi:hypothetical protein
LAVDAELLSDPADAGRGVDPDTRSLELLGDLD